MCTSLFSGAFSWFHLAMVCSAIFWFFGTHGLVPLVQFFNFPPKSWEYNCLTLQTSRLHANGSILDLLFTPLIFTQVFGVITVTWRVTVTPGSFTTLFILYKKNYNYCLRTHVACSNFHVSFFVPTAYTALGHILRTTLRVFSYLKCHRWF